MTRTRVTRRSGTTKKHEDKKHDLALPAPLDSVVDLVTGATGGELPSLPSLPVG
ncbi:hypothetical protein [Pseudonocardia sp. ICBG1142]|uniref:hypothetical protein n=1 Tax=Pseudonocardia sp. ICBG1142 TaxID=2846760 RepID=UPI001CF6F478|nr:hypothetical protein [Pseudonocardia sp. ICBG1142]